MLEEQRGGAAGGTTGGTTDTGLPLHPPGTPGNAGPNASLSPEQPVQSHTDLNGNTIGPNGEILQYSQKAIESMNAGSANAANPSVTYPGLIGQVARTAQGNAAIGSNAAQLAKEAGQQIQEIGQRSAQAQAGYKSGMGTQPVAMGNAAIVAQNAAAQQAAVSQGLQAQLQGTGQQLTGQAQQQAGLTAAAGLAAPQQVGYNVQYINPQTGQAYGGGETSQSLKDTVAKVVEKLNAGTMAYNDALNALSGYGQGGINELQNQLPPGFNIAQSNTLAGQQGSVKVNYELADVALNNVENVMKELGMFQTTNIPIINRTANWISTTFGIGSKETRAMIGAVQSLRNAYASLLASVKGGTPTDYSNQAMAEIPAEPTPNDIAAIRANFETLGQARTQILGNPGQASSGGNQTGPLTWDNII